MVTEGAIADWRDLYLKKIIQIDLKYIVFFVVGLRFSVAVPEGYRLASKVEGVKTADGVAFVAATTNIGFLVGPVLLGFIAELRSLHLSFMVLTAFVSIAFFIAFWKYNNLKLDINE